MTRMTHDSSLRCELWHVSSGSVTNFRVTKEVLSVCSDCVCGGVYLCTCVRSCAGVRVQNDQWSSLFLLQFCVRVRVCVYVWVCVFKMINENLSFRSDFVCVCVYVCASMCGCTCLKWSMKFSLSVPILCVFVGVFVYVCACACVRVK